VTLVPPSWGAPSKPFVLEERQWQYGVQLVERSGFRPNSFSGLSRGDAAPFGRALRTALSQQEVPAGADPGVLGALATFLVGPGAAGVTLSKGYKRWDRT